jgi:hypothetical protein
MSNEKPFKLDIGFMEALRRFTQTDPRELDKTEKEVDKEIRETKKRARLVEENFRSGARTTKHRYRP